MNTVKKIRQTAPNARIILVGPPWAPPEAAERVARVDSVLQTEAAGNGVSFTNPIAEGWLGADLIGPDGVHPTDKGHEVMAAKLTDLITQHLTG